VIGKSKKKRKYMNFKLSEVGAYLAFEEELRKFGWKVSTRLCFS